MTGWSIVYASRLGARAGLAWRDTGIPSRNPLEAVPELAAVWRRSYFHAARRLGSR